MSDRLVDELPPRRGSLRLGVRAVTSVVRLGRQLGLERGPCLPSLMPATSFV